MIGMTPSSLALALLLRSAGGPPEACLNGTHDCVTAGDVGCTDASCCDAICDIDPCCCAVAWDSACVLIAGDLCKVSLSDLCDIAPPGAVAEPEECGESVNNGCNGGADSGSTCCFAWGGFDCDDAACVAIVCGVDAFCCMVQWDQICADEAIALCAELCAVANPPTTPIAIGVPVCGAVRSSPTIDYDWYELTLAEKSEVVVTLLSTLPLTFGIGDADGVTDCAIAIELEPTASSVAGVPTSVVACLEPGTHWIVVRPKSTSGIITCSGGGEYLLDVALGAPRCELPDPPNDVCATAVDIFEGSTPVTTQEAATEPNPAPMVCDIPWYDFPMSRDVWFRFVAPQHGTVRVDTCGTCTFPARLVAYSGTCDDLVQLACSEWGRRCPVADPGFDIEVVAGETYYLQLGSSYPGVDGDATISINYARCGAVYTPIVLVPPPPYQSTKATNLSQDGQLIGSVGIGSTQYPMSWTETTGLVVLNPSSIIVVRDVNDAGLLVGSISSLPAMSTPQGFVQLPGLSTSCVQGQARAVNESGTIVGVMTQVGCPATVVTWSGGAIAATSAPAAAKEPVAITESGTLAGWGATGVAFTTMKGWILEGSTFAWIDPPSSNAGVQFLAMNDANDVAGRLVLPSESGGQKYAPILWKDGVFTNVNIASGFLGGRVADINNAGIACGAWDGASDGERKAFVVATNGHAASLDLLVPTDFPYLVVDAVAINDAGQIAAHVRHHDEPGTTTYAALLTPSAPSGDLDCDGFVDGVDLAMLLGDWGDCQSNVACNADFTLDGLVDAADLAILLGGWGPVVK